MLGNCRSNSVFTSQTPTSGASAEASKNFQQIAHGCRVALPHGRSSRMTLDAPWKSSVLVSSHPFLWREATLSSPFDLEIPLQNACTI